MSKASTTGAIGAFAQGLSGYNEGRRYRDEREERAELRRLREEESKQRDEDRKLAAEDRKAAIGERAEDRTLRREIHADTKEMKEADIQSRKERLEMDRVKLGWDRDEHAAIMDEKGLTKKEREQKLKIADQQSRISAPADAYRALRVGGDKKLAADILRQNYDPNVKDVQLMGASTGTPNSGIMITKSDGSSVTVLEPDLALIDDKLNDKLKIEGVERLKNNQPLEPKEWTAIANDLLYYYEIPALRDIPKDASVAQIKTAERDADVIFAKHIDNMMKGMTDQESAKALGLPLRTQAEKKESESIWATLKSKYGRAGSMDPNETTTRTTSGAVSSNPVQGQPRVISDILPNRTARGGAIAPVAGQPVQDASQDSGAISGPTPQTASATLPAGQPAVGTTAAQPAIVAVDVNKDGTISPEEDEYNRLVRHIETNKSRMTPAILQRAQIRKKELEGVLFPNK